MYSVKKFCDMIGVPLSTLRYYERIGLLDPKKNEKNNYREYTVYDAFQVNSFRAFRGMGFEAKETMDMLENRQPDYYYEKMIERESKIVEELFLLQEQLFAVQNYKKVLELVQSGENYTIGQRKDMFFLKASHGLEFSESTYDQFSKWVQLVPVARYAKYIEAEEFNDKALKHHMHYGIAMECRFEFLLEPKAKENMKYLKGGECIYLHSHNFNYGMDFKEAQQEVEEILKKHQYELDGPIYMEGTRVGNDENVKGQFVSIPVRKRKDVL